MTTTVRETLKAVFSAVRHVLETEERDWATALMANPHAHDRFDLVWGVRAANEVAIAYLAVKRLLVGGTLTAGVVCPERPCSSGRIDLWISAEPGTPGVGIEFKFLMSGREAATVRSQAERLCAQPDATAAAFVLWSHHVDPTWGEDCRDLFPAVAPGWTPWHLEERGSFPALYRRPTNCTVWMWICSRA
jgi:hypothetical protein